MLEKLDKGTCISSYEWQPKGVYKNNLTCDMKWIGAYG
jgi:hypothetical protein